VEAAVERDQVRGYTVNSRLYLGGRAARREGRRAAVRAETWRAASVGLGIAGLVAGVPGGVLWLLWRLGAQGLAPLAFGLSSLALVISGVATYAALRAGKARKAAGPPAFGSAPRPGAPLIQPPPADSPEPTRDFSDWAARWRNGGRSW
jgi:hypothetical protein